MTECSFAVDTELLIPLSAIQEEVEENADSHETRG